MVEEFLLKFVKFRYYYSLIMANGRVIVYGGMGALGSVCVNAFKANKFWVGSIDIKDNADADANIIVPRDAGFKVQENTIIDGVSKALKG